MPQPARTPARQLILATLAIGLVAAAWRAGASSAAPPAAQTPTSVAIIDFNRVYDALKEIADRNVKLADQGSLYRKELDDLTKQIKALQTDQRNAKPGSREDIEAQIAIREAQEQFNARQDGINKRVDLLIGNTNREIYLKFIGTVDYMAKREGWELVMLDDRALIQMPDLAPARQVTETIMRKTILFAAPRVDITDTIINQMNIDYEANPPVDRTPPAPPPPVAKQ